MFFFFYELLTMPENDVVVNTMLDSDLIYMCFDCIYEIVKLTFNLIIRNFSDIIE